MYNAPCLISRQEHDFRMSTAETVLNEIEQITQTDQVRRDLDLKLFDEALLDSLGTVQLMVALSEDFGVRISPAEFERALWATPRKIIEYMEKRVGP